MKEEKTKYMIISAFFVTGVIVLVMIYLTIRKKSIPISVAPTPPMTETNGEKSPDKSIQQNIRVVSSYPADYSKNVSVESAIIINFDKAVDENELIFSITPDFAFSKTVENDQLVINPQASLLPGTIYTYIIKYKTQLLPSKTITFTTEGALPKYLPDTRPSGALELEENFQKVTHTDVFLSNQTPFEGNLFSVTSEFSDSPTGHFRFLVILNQSNPEGATNSFVQWLRSLGLTYNQIDNLDITYQ